MVPIADAFNHTEENHVHLETDWQVCSGCGSLDRCEHDAQDNKNKDPVGKKLEHTYDMVLNALLPADETGEGVEIYNTYDARGIDNVRLLCRYGFILEGNNRDVVLFETEEVIQSGGVAAVIDDAVEELDFGPSEMITTATRGLGIDSEGRISFALWAAFVPDASWTRLARVQCWIEIQSVVEQEGSRFQDIANEAEPTKKDLLDTHDAALKIVCLCDRRLECMWNPIKKSGATSWDSSKLGGSGPSNKETTTLEIAENYVLGERAIIRACRTVWNEFSVTVQDYIGPSREAV
jgi:SET domain-containing protein 6